MKPSPFLRLFPSLPLSLFPFFLSSCFSPLSESDDVTDAATTTQLRVTTRSATGDLLYPVQILAYDINGNLAGQQAITDASQSISLQLSAGTYHLTALSGQEGYVQPASYDQMANTLSIPTAGYATTPLMMGGADVLLTSGAASASLVLTYRVASLDLTLANVPADVTAVTIGVSQQYAAMDLSGRLSGSSAATLQCVQQGDVWRSGQFYLLPGATSSTSLTLALTNAQGQVSYSYALGEALQAAVPYVITGTYVESTAPYIEGVITSEGWQAERAISFDFGEGSSNGGASTSIPTISVSSLPAQGSAWNGHIAALVQNATATEADVLLLALEEQYDVHSPAASGYETEMSTLAQSYSEGSLFSWSVPTEAEARSLKAAYGGHFDDLNATIEQLGGTLITIGSSSSNSRYLCADGAKTFNFAESGSVTSAGTSVKYRLRLVKNVHLVVK